MKIALIAVLDEKNGIGKNNKLLCHLPADLKRFKQLTTGHSIVMGRKTFESLPGGALPNRKNIVITRNKSYTSENIFTIGNTTELFELCKKDELIYIIGGEEIYKLFIHYADILHITRIHHQFDADAFFPAFTDKNWKLIENEMHQPDEKNKFPYTFQVYTKNKQ